MPSLDQYQRRIDRPATHVGGGIVTDGGVDGAAPTLPAPGPPAEIDIAATYLIYSAVTPQAGMTVRWEAPAGIEPDAYVVQWSTSSGFDRPTTRATSGAQRSAGLDGMPIATPIYVRVAAALRGVQGVWSDTASATTPADTAAPAAPTDLVVAWDGRTGDLLLSCTPSASVNARDVRLRVYSASGGTLYRTLLSASGRATWTRAMHAADTSGVYDLSVYIVADARNWSDTYSATSIAATATLAAPSAPTGFTSSWAADSGVAGDDLVVAWTALPSVATYRLTLDGGDPVDLGPSSAYTYSLAANAAQHGGTPDPAISLSLVAVDALGQTSTATTATATNARPPTMSAPTAVAAFTQIGIAWTASAARDLVGYEVKAYLGGTLNTTLRIAPATAIQWSPPAGGSWTFTVAGIDAFGQVGTHSAASGAATAESQAEFIAGLRARVVYSDSIGTAADTLAALKDGNTGTNVVTYAASASAWRWTLADRQMIDRHRATTLATSASASYYYGISQDGSAWSYYAGGTATGGVWSPVAQASEAAAQGAATVLAAGVWRIDMPALTQARYYRLVHRNVSASYALREYYPREIVEADDIRVESLAAISADLGSITAGTITGGTIRTAASGARAELTSAGLKTYNASGAVQIEATTTTDGALIAGQGAVTIDRTGVEIAAGEATQNTLRWVDGADTLADIRAFAATTYIYGYPELWLGGYTNDSESAFIALKGVAGGTSTIDLTADAISLSAFGGEIAISGGTRFSVEDWVAPTLLNSWVNHNATNSPAGYYMDPARRVHLRGLISGGTYASNTVLFTLPTGYRPAYNELHPRTAYFDGAMRAHDIRVYSNGNVVVYWVTAAPSYLMLDGISFRAA